MDLIASDDETTSEVRVGGPSNIHCQCCTGSCNSAEPKYHVTFGCLSSLFCTKRVRRALTAGRKNTVAWIVDSGANIVVVPTADPAIVRLLPTSSQLRTAHGIVKVQHAVIRTPVGDCKGVVSAGSPRLMPDDVLKQKGWDYRRYGKHVFLVSSTDSSRRVRIQREGGCPIITNEQLFQPDVKGASGGETSAILDQGLIAGGAAIEGSAGCGLRDQACVEVSTPPETREETGRAILGPRNSRESRVQTDGKKRNRRSIASRIAHDRIHGTRNYQWKSSKSDKENQENPENHDPCGEVLANPAADRPLRERRAPARFRDDVDPAADDSPDLPPRVPVIDPDHMSDSGSDIELFDNERVVEPDEGALEFVPMRRKSAQKHRLPAQVQHERNGHRGMPDAVIHCPACEQSKVVVADAHPARNPSEMISDEYPTRIIVDYEGARLDPGIDGGQYNLVLRLYQRIAADVVRTATLGMVCRSRQRAECIRKLHEFRTIMHLTNGSSSERWMLHGDNEGAWTSRDMGIYLRAENGILGTSVANTTHAKAAHESAVRTVKETRNAGLYASGAPEKLWPDAQMTTMLLSLVHDRTDVTPGLNLAVRELRIPFGSLGTTHLSKDVYHDPLKRGTVVCFLVYRLDQVYGGQVMYFDKHKRKYRRTNISLADVTWDADGRYGWNRDTAGVSHSQFGPDEINGTSVPVEDDVSELLDLGETMIECERCGRWRWWTNALKRDYRAMRGVDVPEEFTCDMIPRTTCNTPEPHVDANEQWRVDVDRGFHARLRMRDAHVACHEISTLDEPSKVDTVETEQFTINEENDPVTNPTDEEYYGVPPKAAAEGSPTVVPGMESESTPGKTAVCTKRRKHHGPRSSGHARREGVRLVKPTVTIPITDSRHHSLRKILARRPVCKSRAWIEHAHQCDRCYKTYCHNHAFGDVHKSMVCVPCKNNRQAWHVEQRHIMQKEYQPIIRACVAKPIQVGDVEYHKMFGDLNTDLQQALLDDDAWLKDFRVTESSCMNVDDITGMDDDVLLARHAQMMANVARPLKKEEKSHPLAAAARASELKKIFVDNCTFDKPRTPSQAKAQPGSARDTVGRVAMIEVMKHAERQLSDTQNPPKFKARLVFLGNRIWRLQDREHVSPTGADVGLYGCVTTLESFRSVVAYAGANCFEAETTDLTAAYLQAPWPTEKAGRCYAKFTTKDLQEAPESIRKLAEETAKKEGVTVDDLLWEMKRCLYGHPISGHAWITHFTDFLKRQGWLSCHTPGLFRFESLLLCVYVDDLCVAGGTADLAKFWSGLDFVHDGQEPLTAYLGVRVHSEWKGNVRTLKFDMRDYCVQINEAFLKLFDEKRPDGKRMFSPQALSRLPCSCEEQIPMAAQSDPQRRVQKMLGMLLWLHRCTRPDIGYALSQLGTRVTTWNTECSEALARLIAYLRTTMNADLYFRFRKGDTVNFVSHSDASLISPKSQSGSCSFLVGGISFALIAWGSSKQKVAADSSAWAEIVAVHSLVRSTMGMYLDWDRLLVGKPEKSQSKETWEVYQPMTILIDNSTALKIVYEGFSTAMIAAHVMLRLRRDLLRDAWQQGLINVGHVRTDANIADGFTKYLSKEKLDEFRTMCGLVESQSQLLTCFDRITGKDTTKLNAPPVEDEGQPPSPEDTGQPPNPTDIGRPPVPTAKEE